MIKMMKRWMSALCDFLPLSPIERDIAEIRKAMEDQGNEIRKAMEDQVLRIAANQALLTNQQQYLEIMIKELAKSCSSECVD